jgi:hypothetical protein
MGDGFCGAEDRAATHVGSSAVGSRCTVPRGPKVFTKSPVSHSAFRTVSLVPVGSRRAIDTSAADINCACVPATADTTSAGPPAIGVDRPCRARRRAHTSGQVIVVMAQTLANN